MSDLDVIKQLEEKIVLRIHKVTNEEFKEISEDLNNYNYTCYYVLDESHAVISLRIVGVPLSIFPIELLSLTRLSVLDFSNNELISLPLEITKLSNLCKLNLSGNKLTSLPIEISNLKNLQILDLSSNSMTSMPPEIRMLTSLQMLNLTHNDMTSLPEEILSLGLNVSMDYRFGKGVILGGNPIENPPIEIVERGKWAIREWFDSQKEETRYLNEVKVILVGDGGAGKTSLVKCLSGDEFDPAEPMTHGVVIKDLVMDVDGADITAHIWDFGGQEIMHASHEFFMTRRSLYVLVLDGRKDEKCEYWLKHIETFGGDSPVLVVLNKIDENPSNDVNRLDLRRKYPGVKDFYRMSCQSGEGIEAFMSGLQKYIQDVKSLRESWSVKWFAIKEDIVALERAGRPYITLDEYHEICEHRDVNGSETQDVLLRFLHDLGVVLNFRRWELADTKVLNPVWVTNAVYKIINSKMLADSKGILKKEDLDEILHNEDYKDSDCKGLTDCYAYSHEEQRYIVGLMEKFELSYNLADGTELVPGLLGKDEPVSSFEEAGCLKYRLEYDFLPRSVISRFMVKRQSDVDGELRWRSGVVLKDSESDCRALVRAHDVGCKIEVFVSGTRARDYFTVLRKTFLDINKSFSFEKGDVKEMVEIDESGIFRSYQELEDHLDANRSTIFIHELKQEFNIFNILKDYIRKEDIMNNDRHGGITNNFYGNVGQNNQATGHAQQHNVQTNYGDSSCKEPGLGRRLLRRWLRLLNPAIIACMEWLKIVARWF